MIWGRESKNVGWKEDISRESEKPPAALVAVLLFVAVEDDHPADRTAFVDVATFRVAAEDEVR